VGVLCVRVNMRRKTAADAKQKNYVELGDDINILIYHDKHCCYYH